MEKPSDFGGVSGRIDQIYPSPVGASNEACSRSRVVSLQIKGKGKAKEKHSGQLCHVNTCRKQSTLG